MKDEFRPVEGYPGYRVSGDGRVESSRTRRGRLCVLTEAWHPLKPILRGGYPMMNLARSGKRTACKIHRLVLAALVGPCLSDLVACHGDGDRVNSNLSNLRWDTQRANADDAFRHGTRAMGAKCGATKLNEDEVVQIRRLRGEGELDGRIGQPVRRHE